MSDQIKIIDSHKKAIVTKFHGPTNFKGARISASDDDGNRVSVDYDDALNSGPNHAKAANALCEKMEWEGTLVQGWTKTGCVFSFLPNAGANLLRKVPNE